METELQKPDVRFFQVPAFCASLGITRARFYRMLAAGEIAIVKVGRRTLIPAGELEKIATEWNESAGPSPKVGRA